MSKHHLKELYGPGGTFYSGKHLGTSGADSGYSSYIGNKKAGPPHEYSDLEELEEEEDEMSNELLEKRIIDSTGMYRLEATLESLNEENIFDASGDMMRSGARIAKAAGRSTILSLPVIDAIAGSMYLISGITNLEKYQIKLLNT